jgi:hypothetical protein
MCRGCFFGTPFNPIVATGLRIPLWHNWDSTDSPSRFRVPVLLVNWDFFCNLVYFLWESIKFSVYPTLYNTSVSMLLSPGTLFPQQWNILHTTVACYLLMLCFLVQLCYTCIVKIRSGCVLATAGVKNESRVVQNISFFEFNLYYQTTILILNGSM